MVIGNLLVRLPYGEWASWNVGEDATERGANPRGYHFSRRPKSASISFPNDSRWHASREGGGMNVARQGRCDWANIHGVLVSRQGTVLADGVLSGISCTLDALAIR